MKHFHAVVWIDHSEARVFSFGTDGVENKRIRPVEHGGNIHHHAGSVGAGHAHEDKSYLTAIADSLLSAREILIVGHGEAKTTLAHFIRDHVPTLAPRVMGVETLDHPTDPEIVAFARKFFERKDLSTPQL
jgi:stalled ribosome rescue protein Dom34